MTYNVFGGMLNLFNFNFSLQLGLAESTALPYLSAPLYLRTNVVIICPIAIAYSMGQIIKSVCICVSVCLSVCEHSHGRIS